MIQTDQNQLDQVLLEQIDRFFLNQNDHTRKPLPYLYIEYRLVSFRPIFKTKMYINLKFYVD